MLEAGEEDPGLQQKIRNRWPPGWVLGPGFPTQNTFEIWCRFIQRSKMAAVLVSTSKALVVASRPARRGAKLPSGVRAVVVSKSSDLTRQDLPHQGSRHLCALQQAASSRPSWFPGTEAPSHLDGTLAGDYGFDPLVRISLSPPFFLLQRF